MTAGSPLCYIEKIAFAIVSEWIERALSTAAAISQQQWGVLREGVAQLAEVEWLETAKHVVARLQELAIEAVAKAYENRLQRTRQAALDGAAGEVARVITLREESEL